MCRFRAGCWPSSGSINKRYAVALLNLTTPGLSRSSRSARSQSSSGEPPSQPHTGIGHCHQASSAPSISLRSTIRRSDGRLATHAPHADALRVDGGLPAPEDTARFFSELRLLAIFVLSPASWCSIILTDGVRQTHQKFLSIPLRMVSFGTVLHSFRPRCLSSVYLG